MFGVIAFSLFYLIFMTGFGFGIIMLFKRNNFLLSAKLLIASGTILQILIIVGGSVVLFRIPYATFLVAAFGLWTSLPVQYFGYRILKSDLVRHETIATSLSN
jgi:hypothetical protein